MTADELFDRQTVASDAMVTAWDRCAACEWGTPERLEWAFIRDACLREFKRLARLAARQRREQSA